MGHFILWAPHQTRQLVGPTRPRGSHFAQLYATSAFVGHNAKWTATSPHLGPTAYSFYYDYCNSKKVLLQQCILVYCNTKSTNVPQIVIKRNIKMSYCNTYFEKFCNACIVFVTLPIKIQIILQTSIQTSHQTSS